MFNIVLYEPEIAPNSGNIIRLCANSGCKLHLIEPLGFDLEEKKLRRAGLDYRELTEVKCHKNFAAYQSTTRPKRLFAISTKGDNHYHLQHYQFDDTFLFGPETRGLPDNILQSPDVFATVRIPMAPSSRSLNLSNTVAIICYEALRQTEFHNLD